MRSTFRFLTIGRCARLTAALILMTGALAAQEALAGDSLKSRNVRRQQAAAEQAAQRAAAADATERGDDEAASQAREREFAAGMRIQALDCANLADRRIELTSRLGEVTVQVEAAQQEQGGTVAEARSTQGLRSNEIINENMARIVALNTELASVFKARRELRCKD